ncbi:helix-turn-helix transcriptional regulator [Streptomyces sp. AV19]|uniref:helix-turn-helix domain-containing protein n=1 Tax=Streptomyces sp. AV19 TaxID=2793068 RepID=UPI0018FECE69|nr:helix-turn-helix transcriptional regulator [Streptomyces sp. AV19]MBH1935356.1 helix-turn-helix transcriptional regulator [Streptomyces sp. AV19]MDG4531242.1 helix-turn-helix transcriptional regulator [Streptomyces sp. AV19]
MSGLRKSDSGELAFCVPDPRLAGFVLEYTGQDWTLARPLVRRVMALETVLFVIDFEPHARRVGDDSRAADRCSVVSPVTGVRERPMAIEQAGRLYGLTVRLTAPGARALFGLPLCEIANTCVGLADILGARAARQLAERLAEAPDWPARFRLLDGYLIARICGGPELPVPVRRAWQRLTALSGDVRIGALADEVGWSRQHLNARFRQEIGLSPKTVARIARLQRAMFLMRDTRLSSWADTAVASGYADQPHFNRDFRMLTGCTPSSFRALTTEWTGSWESDRPRTSAHPSELIGAPWWAWEEPSERP